MKKKNKFVWLKLLLIALILCGVVFVTYKIVRPKTPKVQYQTAVVEKGTVISTVSASGQVSYVNSAAVTTSVFGTVTKLYVQNGDTVTAGQALATLTLDQDSQQAYLQALSSYQNAANSLASAKASLYTLKSAVVTADNNFLKQVLDKGKDSHDVLYIQLEAEKKSAAAKYSNQTNIIKQAEYSLNNSAISLRQVSPTIYAPISGTISGLSIQVGSVVSEQSSANSNQIKSQKIANITTAAYPVVDIDMTEIDVPKVKIGQKATVTIDALPNKSFTGKVSNIDTVGAVSSGVTTYPVAVTLDVMSADIYANMSASANIIVESKSDTLVVPSATLQSVNGEDTVRVLKDGQVQNVVVEVGIASDTSVEIKSGLAEGDVVVTAVTTGISSSKPATSISPFSIMRPGGATFTGGRR